MLVYQSDEDDPAKVGRMKGGRERELRSGSNQLQIGIDWSDGNFYARDFNCCHEKLAYDHTSSQDR